MADALKNLDSSIKNWIQSDGVLNIIIALNKELGNYGTELSVISQAIISVSLGEVKPENLIRVLAKNLPLVEDKDIEKATAILKKKIFYPLGSAFKRQGIDIDKILVRVPVPEKPKAPAAREVPFSAPSSAKAPADAKAMAGKPPAKPQGWQATPAIEPKARIMEFTPMTDVKKPDFAKASPGRPTSANPAPKNPAPTVNEPEKPFGLSEAVPKAPEPHEVVKYQDEHPMKEE